MSKYVIQNMLHIFSYNQKKVQANEFTTLGVVQEAINILRGAVTIVYPMGLPPHDPIRCEFENTEDLSGTQVRCNSSNLRNFQEFVKSITTADFN